MSAERDAGVAALQQGDTSTAITQLETACAADPEDFEACLYLGAAYGQAGRQADAVESLSRAVRLRPANAQARYNLAVGLEQAGWMDQALAAARQAVQLQSDYTQAHALVARLSGSESPAPPAPTYGDPTPPVATLYSPPTYAQPYAPTAALNAAPYGQSAESLAYAPTGAYPAAPYQAQGAAVYGGPLPYGAMAAGENTSGMRGPLPYELQNSQWNWGAFYFNWIWLCAHNMVAAGIGLFVGSALFGIVCLLIPIIGPFIALLVTLGINIYLGINGNRLAWQNRRYDGVEHLRTVERIWANWALGFFIFSIVIGLLLFVLAFMVGMSAMAR